jgi:hypothetical protein
MGVLQSQHKPFIFLHIFHQSKSSIRFARKQSEAILLQCTQAGQRMRNVMAAPAD